MEETASAQRSCCVIDDDASVRKALERLIRSTGMKVAGFDSAEAFLESSLSDDRSPPDCLIVDVRMPRMSGLELQQRLIAAGRRIPIVFITAHEDESARSCALAAGAAEFLHKPFDDRRLLEAIDKAAAEAIAAARIRKAVV
jgi:FixJ family two-component response regulator